MRFGPGCQCCDPRVCDICTTGGGLQIPARYLISIQDLINSGSPAIPSASPCCDDQEGTYCLAYEGICKWSLDTVDHCNLTVDELTLELTLERRDGDVWVVFKVIDKESPTNYEQFEVQVATSPSITINCEHDLDRTVIPWVSSGGAGLPDCTWPTATITILSTDCSPSVDSCDHCTSAPQYLLVSLPPLVNGDCSDGLGPAGPVTGCPSYGGSYILEYDAIPPVVGDCIWETPWLTDRHTPDRVIISTSCTETGGEFKISTQLAANPISQDLELTTTIFFRDGTVQSDQGNIKWRKSWAALPGPTTPTIDCETIDATSDYLSSTAWACSATGTQAHVLAL